ncbi:probable methyltransferase TARBP1 isoform X2 [Hemicordylus capensis]|uniref:probable methyltransferase TARBP1 isoform X2 n=1 Tax=Hemicordylus capensis TaxID=884348 RepID=UPI0023046124|nr:probable methyltransferase TARBP1 isoform X2 [Hemicordylus capensis]
MELVLADTLLSQCPDSGALLRAVCGEDAALSVERAEMLHFLLQRVAATAGSGWRGQGNERGEEEEAAAARRVAWEAALGRCLPMLLSWGAGGGSAGGSQKEELRLLRAACGALQCCASLCGPPLAERLAQKALEDGQLRTEAAVEVLAALAPWLEEPELLGRTVKAALRLLRGGGGGGDGRVEEEEEEEERDALLVAGRLLPALGRNSAALRLVWEGLMLAPKSAPERVGRTLLVLSALSDAVFPADAQQQQRGSSTGDAPLQQLDARLCSRFWDVVQKGLTESDALCRKRARYLLKRAVDVSNKLCAEYWCSTDAENGPCLFWWCAEKNNQLTQFWDNYILIMETLEGNQIHVIKPVLPKLNSLYEHAVSEQKDCWVFHPSWHMCIYKRMFESDNKTLIREGVFHFLEIWQTNRFPTSPGFSEFITGPLMDALSESSLYSRLSGQMIGTCPPLAIKLQKFLATFLTNLPEEEKSRFLLKFIQKMSNRHWCAVPILFLSMALAHIPACSVLDIEGLLALRDVLQCTMITHQILLRGAAQCYLLKAAVLLTDVEKVSLSDISNFIISLRPEESLGRGTGLWTTLCDWLHANDKCFRRWLNCDVPQDKTALGVYVQFLVEDYLKTPIVSHDCLMPDWLEAKLVATMILLAADVEEMKHKSNGNGSTERIELKALLNPLLDVLLKLGTNPYISTLKTDKCLQLLLKLLQTWSIRRYRSQVDGIITFLQNSFMAATESLLDFLLRRLTANELNTISDLERCNLYLAVFSELTNFCSIKCWKKRTSICSFISSLINASLCNLQERNSEEEVKLGEQIQKVVSMASLRIICEIIDQKSDLQLESLPAVDTLKTVFLCAQLNHVLKKPSSMEKNSSFEEPASHQGWGKIVALYIHDQWSCLHFILNNYQNVSKDKSLEQFLSDVQKCTKTLQSALEAITILPSDHVSPVFHCMKILVSKLLGSSESLCIEAFDLAWKTISSLSNTQLIFWPNLKAFVQFVFDPEVLAAAAENKSQAYIKIKEIMFQMIEMSSTKTGVFNMLLNYCCQSWIFPPFGNTSAVENVFSNAGNYSELLIEACLFGTVFRRDQRLIQEVCAFVENLGEECAANIVTESTKRDDHYVRVCAIKFLCLLDESNPLHKKFIEDFVMKLLDKGELISKSKTRYYVNSLQHRVKNRLWQTLLVLFPKLHEDNLTRTIDRILRAGYSNNQASVKYLIEWTIILILHKFPHFLQKFWDCFSYGEDQLKTSICTYLAVLSHFDIILQNISEKTPVLKKALVVVLQWCFHHNFSVRLYALIALKKIWGLCKALYVDDFETLTPVIECSLNQAESMHGTGNAKKNWQRIQKHFFFENFHPLKDYCLEAIFYTLPRLSDIAEEEWISLSKFTAFTVIPLSVTFPYYHSETELLDLKPSDWSQQDMGLNSAELGNQRQWTDVQKKIIPWNTPDLDLEFVFQDRATKLGKSNSKLIVVASLIDKPTNLGGLCRTCEIFGVSALIVGSLHYVNDKQFQYLSVSAEQWLSLIEVKPFQLVDYLEQKKTEGYTIIGVEQTAKSCDLTEYCFPEKSLLLLGNEHEGIPANLIQQLDICVEIPQQGIIRSLNVHVSGALLIWEYTRQQIIKEKSQR